MKHPYVIILEKLYADLSRGDLSAVLNACAEDMTFQVPGRSSLAGKYTRHTFSDLATKWKTLSSGTVQIEIHDILASDQHAVVLCSDRLEINGKKHEYRVAHIWRFQNAKPVAWYEYPRDLYAFDEIWK
jgi:ketosteroid isomerase-like protein